MPERTCSVDGCPRPTGVSGSARGLCRTHYNRWLQYGSTDPRPRKPKSTCTVDGCDRPVKGQGWCQLHYKRWRDHGDVMADVPAIGYKGPAEGRFWPKVDKHGPVPEYRPDLGPCWLWQSTIQGAGYGTFWDGHHVLAHRFAYELLVGSIPDGLVLDHLCRVRSCVNPAHLEPVTQQVNVLRGVAPAAINAAKTHCVRGHELTEGNISRKGGGRHCLACRRDRYHERKATA